MDTPTRPLSRARALVGLQIAASIPFQLAFVYLARGRFEAPIADALPDRIAFALRGALVAGATLLAMIAFIAGARPLWAETIGGEPDARKLELHVRVQRNTLEQLVVFAVAQLSLATTLPRAELVIRPAVIAALAAAETGDVDLGLVAFAGDAPGLVRRRVLRDPWVVAVRAGHPRLGALARGAPLTAAQHAALPQVRVSPDGHGASEVDAALAAAGLTRVIAYRTPSFATALAVAARTDLAVTVPTRALTAFGDAAPLVAHPLPFLPPLELQLVRHQRYRGDPAIDWLAGEVLAAAR